MDLLNILVTFGGCFCVGLISLGFAIVLIAFLDISVAFGHFNFRRIITLLTFVLATRFLFFKIV